MYVCTLGPSLYYVSIRLGVWGQKIAIFGDVQNCIYDDSEWPWVGPKKPKIC